MKILAVCQHYAPEPFRITDICEALVKRGHEVTVITGTPNYPMGKIYSGYEHGKKRDETINGVKVHRCYEIGRRSGAVFRLLNYYSFAVSSKRFAKRLKEKFDVVFVNQLSPVMMANAGIAYARKHNVPLYMYVMDLWPASLSAGGIKETGVVYKYYHKVSKKIYAQADKLLITSRMFSGYLNAEFSIPEEKIVYLPQYSEDMFTPEECKKAQNGTIDLMFAGNVGKMQSVETIIRAAKKCEDIKNLKWHIVGDGSDLENCKRFAEKLNVTSVEFHGRKAPGEMPAWYAKADAMLVTMKKDKFISYTLPGKVQTYMAAGKPIIGAIDGEAKRVIEEAQCGICGEAENADLLAENVRRFCSENYQEYSENSLLFYETNFKKIRMIDRLELELGR
ncbi:MAG: glycosyltransferase family 4 protein [Candidatus Scatosoma sp.]